MQVEVQAVTPEQVEADVVAVPLTADNELAGAAAALDSKLDGLLERLAGDGELRGEAGRVSLVHVDGKLGAPRVAVAGLGPREHVDADALRTAAAAVARETGGYGGTIAWALDGALALPADEQARALVEGTAIGSYDTARWKQRRAEGRSSSRSCSSATATGSARRRSAPRRSPTWTNRARDLVNSPPNETTPERLAERAQEIASSLEHVTAEALDPDADREARDGRLRRRSRRAATTRRA